MKASAILLQKKYTRIILKFAEKADITLSDALDFFYRSETSVLISEGVSDLHCMSDEYLAEELTEEYRNRSKE